MSKSRPYGKKRYKVNFTEAAIEQFCAISERLDDPGMSQTQKILKRFNVETSYNAREVLTDVKAILRNDFFAAAKEFFPQGEAFSAEDEVFVAYQGLWFSAVMNDTGVAVTSIECRSRDGHWLKDSVNIDVVPGRAYG